MVLLLVTSKKNKIYTKWVGAQTSIMSLGCECGTDLKIY